MVKQFFKKYLIPFLCQVYF